MLAAAWHGGAGWRGTRGRAYLGGRGGVVRLACWRWWGTGFITHGLVHESLTFRWHYWVGAMRVFARHPLAGVGLDNFGTYYLGVRLPGRRRR